MKRSITVFLLFFLFIGFSFDDGLAILKSKSDHYFAKYNRTKLEVFFNQPKYAPGDTVHFRMLYVKAADLKPVQKKQIVHICLFDQNGKKSLVQWATVVNGEGFCEMVIPSEFASGNYLFVAFTDWMKNFDKELFFKQKFIVADKFQINSLQAKDSVLFFPEGGSLIANTENNLAVGYFGIAERSSIIVKEGKQEIALVKVVKDSVSSFLFTPKANTDYQAELVTLNGIKKFKLPQVVVSGISVKVDCSNLKMKVKVSKSLGMPPNNTNYIVLVYTPSEMVFTRPLSFEDIQTLEFTLPENLPDGVLQLVVTDEKTNLIARRVLYKGTNGSRKIKVDGLENEYETRAPVNLSVAFIDAFGNNVPGTFSCRIINNDLLGEVYNDINYLAFQSDLSNSFPFHYQSPSPKAIANYLITQTCPWFNWNLLIEDNSTSLQYQPQEYLTMSGNAILSQDEKPVRDSTLLMFFLEKGLRGYETYSKKGRFSFPLFYSSHEPDKFFYTASYKGNDMDGISVEMDDLDSTILFFAEPWQLNNMLPDKYSEYSLRRNVINNSYSFFLGKEILNDSINDPNKAMEEELTGADVDVALKDFLMMPSMEEVIREILKAVEYRKIKGRDVVRVYTTDKKPTNKTGPLYVIDGKITKDPYYFMSLKPQDVLSIKIVRNSRKLFPLGKLGANGVILVKTKLKGSMMQEKHFITFSGFLKEEQSVAATSKKSNAQTPVFRSCLFWSPRLLLGDTLRFHTSDDLGNFKIQIFGLPDEGTSRYGEFSFRVKH